MVKVGDRIPDGKLHEALEFDAATGCPMNPREVSVSAAAAGKKIAIFAVPGAFTPTCTMKHLPGYVENLDKLRASKVDEVWCVATNDAFVMAAWGRDRKATGKIRMLADGSGTWTRALGLDMDLTARGMGLRSQRYSMLLDDGVIRQLNVEAPGKFEVSDAGTLLRQLA